MPSPLSCEMRCVRRDRKHDVSKHFETFRTPCIRYAMYCTCYIVWSLSSNAGKQVRDRFIGRTLLGIIIVYTPTSADPRHLSASLVIRVRVIVLTARDSRFIQIFRSDSAAATTRIACLLRTSSTNIIIETR